MFIYSSIFIDFYRYRNMIYHNNVIYKLYLLYRIVFQRTQYTEKYGHFILMCSNY